MKPKITTKKLEPIPSPQPSPAGADLKRRGAVVSLARGNDNAFLTELESHFARKENGESEYGPDNLSSVRSELTEVRYEELPPDFNIAPEEAKKYFGANARIKFYEQIQSLHKQKTILGTKIDDPLSRNIMPALKKLEEQFQDPEPPVAVSVPVKTDIKIVIRTQTMNPMEHYDQMRIIQKPVNLSISTDLEDFHLSDYNSPFLTETAALSSSTTEGGRPDLRNRKTLVTGGSKPDLRKDSSSTNKRSLTSSPVKLKPLQQPKELENQQQNYTGERRPSNRTTPRHSLSPIPSQDNNNKPTKRKPSNAKKEGISKNPSEDTIGTKEEEDDQEAEESHVIVMTPTNSSLPSETDLLLKSGLSSPNNNNKKLEFICIDYRDGFNKKVSERLKKSNSLFQYVESRQINRDFYDDDYHDQENQAFEEEINQLKKMNPLPAVQRPARRHQLQSSNSNSSVVTATTTRSKGKRKVMTNSMQFEVTNRINEREAAGNGRIEEKKKTKNSSGMTSPIPRNEDDTTVPLSPRSRYIDNCIRQRLNPRACLILRKRFTRELNLKHLGMGDKMAILLAEAIISVPYIHSLNVCDNNLNDPGLSAIVNSIQNMTELVELDMSFNVIGPDAAGSLRAYLSRPNCPLKKLILQKADVDDDEARDFVQALEHNTNLEELDLSENLVGSSENLNTVLPDITTGGEALADLLQVATCPLKTLKLGWNLIRLDGAVSLCKSLAFNTSLTYLELSYNSLNNAGGIALGDALQDNQVLKTLKVANNALDSCACLTICAGIFQNEALESICFDENPIGEQGAKVLMLLPTIIGSRVHVSARNCNLQIKDPKNHFDSSMLIRSYNLQLDSPFDRAIAILLTHLIPSHQTYLIANSEYYDPEKRQTVNLELKEAVDKEYYKRRPLGPEQLKVIDGLKRILAATEDVGKAIDLFKMVDEDGSGELDEEEFSKLIDTVGMDSSKSGEILAEYDVDGGGVIEISEFLLFLKTQRKEAMKRLQELTEYPILYSGLEFEESDPKKVRYLPPRKGTLKLVVVDGFTQKETYRVISPEDRTNILKIAEDSGDLLTMTSFGVKNYKIRLYEAISLAHSLMRDSDKVQVLSTVLPQMSHPQEARLLVNKIIDYSITGLTRLKRAIGQFYRVILGRPDGYYCLDLTNEMDRCCINRLLEISMTTQYQRSKKRSTLGYGRLGDTSQKANYSCFRNEMLSRRPVDVTTDFASPLPRCGKLEFDFVSQKHYNPDFFIINDVRFTNLLLKTCQLRKQDRTKVLKALYHMKRACNRTINGNAKRIYEIPKEKAIEIGFFQEEFYAKITERMEQIEKYRTKEGVKTAWEFDPNKMCLRLGNIHRIYQIPSIPEEKIQLLMHGGGQNALGKKNLQSPSMEMEPTFSDLEEEDEEDEDDDDSDDDKEEGKEAEEEQEVDEEEEEGEDAEMLKDLAMEAAIRNAVASSFRVQTPLDLSSSSAAAGAAQVSRSNRSSVSTKNDPSFMPLMSPLDQEEQPQSHPTSKRSSFVSPTTLTSQTKSKNNKKSGFLPETLNRFVCLIASRNIPIPTKAAKTLELLIDTFETVFMMMRHMEIIVILFENLGSLKTSDSFGTYRVELIIALFGNIVDVYNIEILFRHLSSFEIACLYCRLGMLNLFNPMKPEGGFSFNLARHEERQCVKMLAHLAVVEPGDNLPFVQFRWEREMDCMPGYELTELWMTEDGMPKKGIWDCSYYAGEGKDKNGCKPAIKCRKGLLQLVFLEEDEMMTEEEREKQEKKIVPVGPSYVSANMGNKLFFRINSILMVFLFRNFRWLFSI
jgi:Ran GTPase-activating protein (RanGAP) involved in mRNA processing and transport